MSSCEYNIRNRSSKNNKKDIININFLVAIAFEWDEDII